jgi:hypothetical protein
VVAWREYRITRPTRHVIKNNDAEDDKGHGPVLAGNGCHHGTKQHPSCQTKTPTTFCEL